MEYCINEENIKKRLDVFLTEQNADFSRSQIKRLIDEKKITVNGKTKKSGYVLKLNDQISITSLEKEYNEVLPKQMDIDIVYEDDDVIIVNKDEGVVVHPGNGNYTDTLVNGLLYSHSNNLSNVDNDVLRPGIVHRIDKDTTGVIVIAKNDKAHRILSEQFKDHSITRKYIALVKGILKEDEITIDKPIGRNPKDRLKMAVTNINSKRAVTHIKVLERFYESKITLVEATLETGRTHQIRVHLKSLGYPLLGDLVYGTEYKLFKVKTHMLHAKKLGFIHPTTNEYVEFETEAPAKFNEIVTKLKNREEN